MKRSTLTGERITELSLRLAMLSSQRTVGQTSVQYEQLQRALSWHRQSCRALTLGVRIVQALFSGRFSSCIAFFAQQRDMLQLAADEATADSEILGALVMLSTAAWQFELGPDASPKQRLAFAACEIPDVRARFAQLVRTGQVGNGADGLKLLNVRRRRIAAYGMLALMFGWPATLFIVMAVNGAISLQELVGHLIAAVGFSVYMTRDLFTAIREDERAVEDLNSQLRPRAAREGKAR